MLLFGFLAFAHYFAGKDKTHLIRESKSPDGKFVAEIREVITPMHGGPDLIQVAIRPAGYSVPDIIYSQTFECGPDDRAFQLAWLSPKTLGVSYGMCDAGQYRRAADNKVTQKITDWHDVSIQYRQSDYIAHGSLGN